MDPKRPIKWSLSWTACAVVENWPKMEITVGDGLGSIMALTCWWPTQTVLLSLKETLSVSHVEALSVYNHDVTLRTDCASHHLTTVEKWFAAGQLATSLLRLKKTRNMWWWIWTVGSCLFLCTWAVTSSTPHQPMREEVTHQSQKAAPAAYRDQPNSSGINRAFLL